MNTLFPPHTHTPVLSLRPALPVDRSQLDRLLGSDSKIHTHLDWKSPQAWLGSQAFHFAIVNQAVVAALAAPPDPPDTAWIRLAAVLEEFEAGEALDQLWVATRNAVIAMKAESVACMLLNQWLIPHLERWQFAHVDDVITLHRSRPNAPAPIPPHSHSLRIRRANTSHLRAIAAIDAAAFAPPWQYSERTLREALSHAEIATIAQIGKQIAGYQISTGSAHGGHLARLAVLPDYQGCGIGHALVSDLIRHFDARGAESITVNTQQDNTASLALYWAFGFEPAGEKFPVWQYPLV